MSIYKGNKLVAGGSIDTHFVRRPAWSQAIELSPVDLTAGYKAPADGMIVGSFYYSGTGRDYYFTLNGTNIMPVLSKKGTNGDIARPLTLSLTVNKGDIIGCADLSASNIELSPSIKFVPFENSTVSDVEVVTPELIRNLIRNLQSPDWTKAVELSVTDLFNKGYNVPSNGIIVGYFVSNPASTTYFKINNITVARASLPPEHQYGSEGNVQCPVNKGDHITLEPTNTAEVYKLAGGLAFVPYKAQ